MSGGVFSMFGSAAQHLSADLAGPSAAGSASDHNSVWDQPGRSMDLVFIMDATGSMGSYINSATKNIETICENIIHSEQLSGPGALRIGLIAYRDHPPQDHTYIVKNFGFHTEVERVKENLKSLFASGGGDGPEAVTAAMKAALELDWRPHATKLAVLIADAPPHGIGEYGDGFSDGSPDGQDPLRLARQFAKAGIPLFVIACEPALSGYAHAADFYQGLVKITGATLLPLTTASLLTHSILGLAGEAMDLERLHREMGDAVAERLRSLSLEASQTSNPMDDVARELHERLLLRNENTKQIYIESIYRDSEQSRHNIEVWSTAPDLPSAKPHIVRVTGSRLSDKYLQTRRAATSYKPYTPFSHPPSMPSGSSSTPSPSRAGGGGGGGGSRKVISDFSAFSAGPGMSVQASGSPPTQTSSTFGSGASPRLDSAGFGYKGAGGFSYRGRDSSMMDDDDDDDKDDHDGRDNDNDDELTNKPLPVAVSADGIIQVQGDDGQTLAYRQGAISLDQVRRLAMQSAYRGGLAAD